MFIENCQPVAILWRYKFQHSWATAGTWRKTGICVVTDKPLPPLRTEATLQRLAYTLALGQWRWTHLLGLICQCKRRWSMMSLWFSPTAHPLPHRHRSPSKNGYLSLPFSPLAVERTMPEDVNSSSPLIISHDGFPLTIGWEKNKAKPPRPDVWIIFHCDRFLVSSNPEKERSI